MELSKDNNLSMITYPRSGKNWLYWYITNNTDLKVNFTHHFNFNQEDIKGTIYEKVFSDPIITTVRDPIECLSSINTMEKGVRVQERIDSYIDHYNFMLNNASMFFLFEDLKENTNKVVKHICNEFNGNMDIINDSFDDYRRWHIDTQDARKLVSSKDNVDYKTNLEYIKGIDLSEHYRLYEQAKLRCIDLTSTSSQVG